MNLDDYKGLFNLEAPAGYADSLADKVMGRIMQEEQAHVVAKTKRSRIIKISAWIASAAAVIVAGLFALSPSAKTADPTDEYLYEDYATFPLIESSSTYSLCDYFYDNTQSNEITYSAAEFADYGHRLSGDIIIEGY